MDAFDPTPGMADRLEPGLRRVLAPNPAPMTFRGTNTYLLGQGDVAVIDPGPDRPEHLRAILDALEPGERIGHILVTHSHVDHSPLARALAAATGAPVLGFGDSAAGIAPDMIRLGESGRAGGGEGIDAAFRPDIRLADGETLRVAGRVLTAIWTPGHLGNHLCLAWGDALFTGDHVMGWASSMVSPPDGDLTAFMASCRKLQGRSERVFYPGHGAPVTAPGDRLAWLIAHREARSRQILAALEGGAQDIPALTGAIYTEVPAALLPAAARNVFAHLIDLWRQDRVRAEPDLSQKARFSLV